MKVFYINRKRENKMKIQILKCLFCLICFVCLFLVVNIFTTNKIYAYIANAGSSIIIPNFQVYVDGTSADKPNTVITVGTNKPTFFGYSLRNVIVEITINTLQNKLIRRSVTTDNNGYWYYTLNKTLSIGTYKLFINLIDATGASSGRMQVSTFNVPGVLGSSTRMIIVPPASIKKLNYLTISLIVFFSVALLILFYALAKRHKHVDE